VAKQFGCTVYGTAGSEAKVKRLAELNIDHAVNYRESDFEQEIRARTQGQGVDVVLETIGGEVYRKSSKLLAPFGRMVVLGFAELDLQKWKPSPGGKPGERCCEPAWAGWRSSRRGCWPRTWDISCRIRPGC
jgi:NADPH:quinone reductase-like Zn-dependent oxidoreductase